jgi:putative membrane protein
MMYGWGGYGNGHDVWGFLFMFFVMVLIVVGIVIVVRSVSRDAHHTGHNEDALDVLKKRYAKGDISKEEFDRIKKDIQ